MSSVSELGYIGIGTRNDAAWKDLAVNVLGMQVVPGDDKATAYLRMDAYHHRLELRPSDSEDVEFVGWEVPDAVTLHRVAQQLEDGGVAIMVGTRSEADDRRVAELIACVDPNGIRTEVYCGRPIDATPFHPTRAMSGFKTDGMGLGHILTYVQNLDETVRFYRDLLGMRVSDFTEIATPNGKLRLAFLHCNPRHHSIALIEAPGPKRLNHILLECNALNDVGTGRDLCLQRNIPIAIDLGCHMNDRMVSFYMANPSGFALEYGYGGRMVDDATWKEERYTSVDSIWGHPELKAMVNGPPPA